MIIVRIDFEQVPTMPGLPVQKTIEPARHPGWVFAVRGDRLVITAPAGHLETPTDAVQQELTVRGHKPGEAVHVMSEPLSRVRLTLLDDGDWSFVEGPSRALRNARENAEEHRKRANEQLAARQAEQAAKAVQVKRGPKPGPKPLSVPPGFRGNPAPPPSGPEEDAPADG